MKINYISDLHLEFGPTPELPGGDILLIAGDTIPITRINFEESGNDIKRFSKLCDRFDILIQQTKKYQVTYVIMGNHEHYNGMFNDTETLYRDILAEQDNIVLLENEVDEILSGLKIYGATFWTDYGNFYNKNLDTARTGMNDHYYIYQKTRDGGIRQFTPETAYDVNKNCRNKLNHYLDQYPNDKFIVMTHHTPSLKCGHEKWGGIQNRLNFAFHNTDMESFIENRPNIIHWVSGHTHDSFEGKIGDCNIHINPRGYVNPNGIPENPNFDPNKYFEVNS